MTKLQVLLMAAGASSRMGTQKALLPWGAHTLLEHQLSVLHPLKLPVTVVLGAQAAAPMELLKNLPVPINCCYNPLWEKGLGTSIAFGTQEVFKSNPHLEGLLIALADQPLVETSHFLKMLESFQPGNATIVVSQSSDGHWSVPALFDVQYFPELQKLQGDRGAMSLIQKHHASVAPVICETSLEDMDTPEAYQQMLRNFNSRL
ncbi:MAG TPA: nucleotidyltransferase family protein [Flavobacteriaceae bacterium]|nr:nucleotidyltransferase family protein [Flavobacteriaceae bacterium]MCB9213742.1 nucleotidyltransferase family protein [Alteromonas sp.]HPF12544.1 nucleotidyltransferase family protein [Flavobacteriaceae bacterium]HQU22563.1 nucleotidyltransferase family protein [Flavobacteriaceae bacterium]HQU66349.1 nucleotidyltransferase family protein [Flavobacteriaceae bacterium]